MSAPAVKSQWPSDLKQLRITRVSSWLGPSSGNSVVAVLLAAAHTPAGSNIGSAATTANPDTSRIIDAIPSPLLTPRVNLTRDYSS